MERDIQDYKAVLTEIIQKLIVLLGAGMTLTKLHDVHGLTVTEDGTVTDIQGEPQVVMQNVLDRFIDLSEDIIKHLTEPLVKHQAADSPAVALPAAPIQPDPAPTMVLPTTQPSDTQTAQAIPAATPLSDPAVTEPAAMPTPQPQSPSDPFPTTQPTPADPTPTQTTPPPAMPEPTPMPTADPSPAPATPEPTSAPTSATTPAPATPTPAGPAQPDQTDPDMQHIINEALKQTK